MGLVTGHHACNPRTHSQWVVDPGRTPQRTRRRAWESARPQTPHTQARGAPPGPSRAAPTACKASTQKQACLQGGARPQARQGDKRTRPPPNELKSLSTGPRQETQRGTNRWERPYRRPAPEPRVVRAPHRPGGGGGGRECRGSRSAHTPNGHACADLNGKRTVPTCNGVPAGEGKGQLRRTTRNMHREGGKARQEPKGRHRNGHRPRNPQASRARRTHTTSALHPPRQY